MKPFTARSFLRSKRFALGLAAVALASGAAARAQDVSLTCSNDFHPPLISFNLPCFPQALNVQIMVLTDGSTPAGPHDVVVIEDGFYVHACYFNVFPGGSVSPDINAHPSSQGQTPTGPVPSYYTTTVGVYTFSGDNDPIWAWVSNSTWQDHPITDKFQFNLDSGATGWKATAKYSKNYTVVSNYHYNEWAWHTFLGYEWPYLAGAAQPPPVSGAVVFDLRNYVQQAPEQPYLCYKCGTCKHMAVASLDRFQAGVAITDTPISYTPGLGMNMAFTLSYHQRLTNQPAVFNYSNVGPQWSSSWISYIAGGPTNGQSAAIYRAPDGSQFIHGGYQQTVTQGVGSVEVNEGDFQQTDGWNHATLHYRQNPERYERWLPDGSTEIYAQPVGANPNRLFFLTSMTDPQNNTTTLAYDANAASNGQALLLSVTDPTGSKLIFGYDTANPLQIVKVTRSKDNLSTYLQYTNGKLSSITDPIGITSAFQYASGTAFINQMTTPYGNTTFNSTDGNGFLEADMTNPLGQMERIEYQESLSTSLVGASDSSVPSATGLNIDNTQLNTANSFYWNRRAIHDASSDGYTTDSAAFYTLAQVTHWAESDQGSIPVPLATKMPLEGRVWFNYPAETDPDYVNVLAASASTAPSITARLLDGGATQTSQASYNANGLITQSIDPIGRTTNYTYASNGIDLTQVSQTRGGGQDVLSTMTYNPANTAPQHVPLTATDASGRTTTMTYATNGQLATRTDALSETTTMAYDSNYYLHTVTGPVTGAVTTYTYDSAGRTQTVTDSEGYVLTMAYDNLDRPVSTTYPDSTTDLTTYNKLDVATQTDRQGRVTRNQYDAIRELLQTTDPLGRTTTYTWCFCGGLATLTDANHNTTMWGLDLQGRVTSKSYAGSGSPDLTYVYETDSSRLHTMTDAKGNVSTYAYNVDNTLASTAYTVTTLTTPATVVTSATPNVSFSYDTAYNRLTSMADGTGTTTYSYNTITGSVTTGAGRLASVSEPIASTTGTISYSYDVLGRMNQRKIDGANPVGTSFDTLGRVTGVTNALCPSGQSFVYAYVNTTSRLASMTYPSSTTLSTSYSYFPNTDPRTSSGCRKSRTSRARRNSRNSITLTNQWERSRPGRSRPTAARQSSTRWVMMRRIN